MKAIETRYKEYRFRSRLEARWAYFFDQIGMSWEYEPEGFDLGDGVWYLPDFRVTNQQGKVVWYEIKPAGVTSDYKFEKFKTQLAGSGVGATLVSGDPASMFEGRRPIVSKEDPLAAKMFNKILKAARKARQARFEHGERADG